MATKGILNIPISVRCAILHQLPTVEDVFSAIQSTRFFYEAFEHDSTLVGSILSAQIDSRLLPYVSTFLEFDKADPDAHYTPFEILPKCLSKTPSEAQQQLATITLKEGLHVLERYKCIQYFAKKYAENALTLLRSKAFPRRKPSFKEFSPSEMYRIERSFYTFELYCFLFGRLYGDMLCCVHDFLLKELRPAFTEVAQHDIEFGEIPIHWIGDGDEVSWLHGFLVLGVEFLKQVITASTYEDRQRFLSENLFIARSFPSLESCLLGSNHTEIPRGPEWLDDVKRLNNDVMSGLREGPSPYKEYDPDSGPAEIWFQAHKGDTNHQLVVSHRHQASRDVAYVMMDISRKESMASFNGPKKSKQWEPPFDQDKCDDEFEKQIESCRIRELIYNRGGRGWWSFNDSTRVKWPSKARKV